MPPKLQPSAVFLICRSLCVPAGIQANAGTCAVAVSKSFPGSTLLGEPPAGTVIWALLGRSQSGGPPGFFTCAWTMKLDDQPGGTFTGGVLMPQVSTAPT